MIRKNKEVGGAHVGLKVLEGMGDGEMGIRD